MDGRVRAVHGDRLELETGTGTVDLSLRPAGSADDWHPLPTDGLAPGQDVRLGQVVARTDSERAYVVMMLRFLPVGLLGLMAASLLAAFMSTIDTHVNLASSFFVNDIYRRFLSPDAAESHYVTVARLAGVGVMAVSALFAYYAESISDLFTFILAFLGGVGPVYILRWLWWRVRASTEITAMLTSAATTVAVTLAPVHWRLGPLSHDGELLHEARLLMVVGASLVAALISMAVTRTPDPATLVAFYDKVRPVGWWGPVRELASPHEIRPGEARRVLFGVVGGLSMVYGALFGVGHWILGSPASAVIGAVAAVLGAVVVSKAWSSAPAA